MDKRITKILRLVHKINSMGGKLIFNMNDFCIDIYDAQNGCKSIFNGRLPHTMIYIKDWAKDEIDKSLDGAIEILSRIKEDMR